MSGAHDQSRPGGAPAADAPATLRRELGLGQLTASGIGIIIGAGIYVLLGAATESAGAGVWMSFVGAGLLSALTALSYAELASMYPSSGAEYEYTRRVAPAWVAFVVGWMMIAGLVVAAATVSLGFARYVSHFADIPERLSAFVLLGAVTLVASLGIQRSARVTVALSLVQVGGLVAIIAIGLPHLGDHSLSAGSTPGSVLQGAALVFFAFIGFDEVITLGEETRTPGTTVPRALLLALAVSTVLYVGVAVSAVSVLGGDALAASRQPLTAVASTAIGHTAGGIIAAVAIVATTNTTLLALTAASRLLFGMAATGAIRSGVGRLNRHGAPVRAVATVAAVAAVGVAVGNLVLIASITDVAVYVVFLAVNLTVIALRVRQPHRRRPFRVPLSVGPVPLPTVGALLAVLAMLPALEVRALLWSAGLVVLALVFYIGLRPPAARPTESSDPAMIRRTVSMEEARRVALALRIDFDAVEFDEAEFHHGLQMELAHGRADPDTNVTDDSLVITAKIALAHLNEIPDYYTRLDVMERDARNEWKRR